MGRMRRINNGAVYSGAPSEKDDMMRTMILATTAIAALGLTACGDTGGGDSILSSGPPKREAGSWKTDMKVVKFAMPGMPAEAQSGMKQMMEGMSGIETCLTAEQAAKEDLAEEISKGPSGDTSCTFSKKDMTGSTVSMAGTCKAANGQEMKIAMDGTVSSKKTDVTISTSGQVPQAGQMEMVMQVTSTHVGPCKAGTPEA